MVRFETSKDVSRGNVGPEVLGSTEVDDVLDGVLAVASDVLGHSAFDDETQFMALGGLIGCFGYPELGQGLSRIKLVDGVGRYKMSAFLRRCFPGYESLDPAEILEWMNELFRELPFHFVLKGGYLFLYLLGEFDLNSILEMPTLSFENWKLKKAGFSIADPASDYPFDEDAELVDPLESGLLSALSGGEPRKFRDLARELSVEIGALRLKTRELQAKYPFVMRGAVVWLKVLQ